MGGGKGKRAWRIGRWRCASLVMSEEKVFSEESALFEENALCEELEFVWGSLLEFVGGSLLLGENVLCDEFFEESELCDGFFEENLFSEESLSSCCQMPRCRTKGP